jgi:hypothetical protein
MQPMLWRRLTSLIRVSGSVLCTRCWLRRSLPISRSLRYHGPTTGRRKSCLARASLLIRSPPTSWPAGRAGGRGWRPRSGARLPIRWNEANRPQPPACWLVRSMSRHPRTNKPGPGSSLFTPSRPPAYRGRSIATPSTSRLARLAQGSRTATCSNGGSPINRRMPSRNGPKCSLTHRPRA